MAQALTLKNTTIHCDSCGHEFAGKVEDWHRKACPKCAAPGIVDDEDMAQYRALLGLAEMVNGLLGDVPKGHATTFRFNSAATKDS